MVMRDEWLVLLAGAACIAAINIGLGILEVMGL